MTRFICPVSLKRTAPQRLKENPKVFRDQRRVKLACSKRTHTNLANIQPLFNEKSVGISRSKYMKTLEWAKHNRKIDNSKEAIERATRTFETVQLIRKKNGYRSMRGAKRIPLTDETIKQYAEYL